MYVKYVQIFRRLEQCYDQIVQPQKRRVLRHALDAIIGRRAHAEAGGRHRAARERVHHRQ